MKIREFTEQDYMPVIDLLKKVNVEPPVEKSDFNGICLVAEENDKIIGCIWALTGMSSKAYIDYFAVDPEYQYTSMGWNLVSVLDGILQKLGVKRYDFYIEPDNKYFIGLIEKYREALHIRRLKDLRFYRREIGDNHEDLPKNSI